MLFVQGLPCSDGQATSISRVEESREFIVNVTPAADFLPDMWLSDNTGLKEVLLLRLLHFQNLLFLFKVDT